MSEFLQNKTCYSKLIKKFFVNKGIRKNRKHGTKLLMISKHVTVTCAPRSLKNHNLPKFTMEHAQLSLYSPVCGTIIQLDCSLTLTSIKLWCSITYCILKAVVSRYSLNFATACCCKLAKLISSGVLNKLTNELKVGLS